MKKNNTLVILMFFAILATTTNKLFSQIDLKQGLVAYYPFDGDTKDYSVNNNDGVIIGAPTLSADRWGNPNKCYNFNGNGDYVRVEHDSTIQPKTAVSVAAWVNADDYSSWLIVVCKRNRHASSPGNSYVLLGSGNAGQNQSWMFGTGSTSSEKFTGSPTLAQTQQWVHLVGTYDKNAADSNLRLYVDGTLVSSEKISYDIGYSDSALRIGMAIPGPSLQYFKGKIDEVRIYNRAINSQEITALYNNTNTSIGEVASQSNIQVYPNPASDVLYINGNDRVNSTLFISDILGKNVLKKDISNTSNIDISDLAAGVYSVSLFDESGNMFYTNKLIVQ